MILAFIFFCVSSLYKAEPVFFIRKKMGKMWTLVRISMVLPAMELTQMDKRNSKWLFDFVLIKWKHCNEVDKVFSAIEKKTKVILVFYKWSPTFRYNFWIPESKMFNLLNESHWRQNVSFDQSYRIISQRIYNESTEFIMLFDKRQTKKKISYRLLKMLCTGT